MTSLKNAKCPKCGAEIELTEALLAPILDAQAKTLEQDFKKKEQDLKKQSSALAAHEQELTEQAAKLQLQVKTLEASKAAMQEEVSRTVEDRLREEKKKIEKEQADKARREAKAEQAEELAALQAQLSDKSGKLQDMKKLELQLRKEKDELETQKNDMELEVARKISEERNKIRSEAKEQAQQEHMLALADKEKKLTDMAKQIDELKKKSEQGSQQSQGEVLELILQDSLTTAFVTDEILEVPKGINGADCVQKVHSPSGLSAGTILWESKRTKSWNNEWITKLKEDQRIAGADLAVIVSLSLPNDLTTFALIDGVWVVSIPLAVQLATALRIGLIETAIARQASANQSGKMEIMYSYLVGPAFKRRIEGIIDPFKAMLASLEKEKRAINKTWAEREQQINRVMISAAGMHGDLQGIIGQELPEIDSLNLLEAPSEE
jgi:hypothetical protein